MTHPKILRVLRKGSSSGWGHRTIRVDVRIVTARKTQTWRPWCAKRFREDLYYRLNVITITAPPLRERREDVAVLAQHFLRVYAVEQPPPPEG